jgi:hypothetical protein
MERSVGASADLIQDDPNRAREQYLDQWRGVISFNLFEINEQVVSRECGKKDKRPD